ncbi:MAG: alkaline phosphatase family protein, partial [Bryocella sp.]
RGFNDPRAVRQANGNSVFLQTEEAGNTYAPWRLDIKDTKITWMGSIPHSRESQIDAWHDGQHDKWIDAKRSHNLAYGHVPITMGHYTREDLPFYYALADAFTVCDQSYCAAMTSTTPNRIMFWTGTVRNEQNPNSRVFMRNEEIMIGGQTWKTFPERLQDAGVSWKFYQNDLQRTSGLTKEENAWLGNFGLNIMEAFSAYNVTAYPYATANTQAQLDALEKSRIPKTQAALAKATGARATRLKLALHQLQRNAESLKGQLVKHGKELYDSLTPAQKALHDAAFVTNVNDPNYRSLEPLEYAGGTMNVPKGDVLHQFRSDVKNGKLPTISWLGAPEHFSDHPTSPWYGAWYVSEVMDILTQNPEVWKKTIFILTYDENDGYFDHAPSFVAADPKRPETGGASSGIGSTALEYTYAQDEMDQGVSPEESRSGPIGMGFRIPTIVASPWSRGGFVNSQLFDHTSTIMFLEKFVKAKTGKDVHETNISPWRRSISGDLTSCFRPVKENEPKLSYLNRDKFVVQIQEAKDKEIPANFKPLTPDQMADVNTKHSHSQWMSKQEPGTRPANALPYELYADSNVHDGKLIITMRAGAGIHGARSMGAPFN